MVGLGRGPWAWYCTVVSSCRVQYSPAASFTIVVKPRRLVYGAVPLYPTVVQY